MNNERFSDFRKEFEHDTGHSLICQKCYYIPYSDCCPEDNDCIMQREFYTWVKDKLTESREREEIYLEALKYYGDGNHFLGENNIKKYVLLDDGKIAREAVKQGEAVNG